MSCEKEIKSRILLWFSTLVILFLLIFCTFNLAKASTFIWQDFEYWDSPQNHGWLTSTPFYPAFGPFPIGYGLVSTVIDYRLQSRVMKLEGFNSPFNQFYRFQTWNQLVIYPNGKPVNDKKVISMNLANRFGIEQFDQFEIQIQLITRDGRYIKLIYRPVGIGASGPEIGMVMNSGMGTNKSGDPDDPRNPLIVIYNLGRQYMDGTWHLMVRDLDQDIRNIGSWHEINFENDGFGNPEFLPDLGPGDSRIVAITLIGFNLLVDNIAFHDSLDNIINHPPKLQRIGPQYAQIFTKFSYIITVNDIDDNKDFYKFIATIGGYGYHGIQTSRMLYRIKPDPNSNATNPIDPNFYVKCNENCLGSKVLLEFTPQTFEDLIVTVKVTDPGGLSDIETFPLSIINYPIVNHPPYLEEIENDIYMLGENDGYFVKGFLCYDQDLEDDPGEPEDGRPGGNIVYTALIDGQSSYTYGPWLELLIPDRFKPLIKFRPRFEGTHNIIVMARDQMGYTAITEFNLIVVNNGTWLNHPPIICEDIDSPQIGKAGEIFNVPIEFIDPDGDQVYYSCNIGSITEMREGLGITPNSSAGQTITHDLIDERYGRYVSGAIFNFLTNFPGIYHIEIIAYDIRGGYCIVDFLLDIQPWWSSR